jgi:2,4-dienoyl-CoA reductase-like NADH-dependent reductase (Old Yellow Enzyme family)
MKTLFDETRIGTLQLRNRLVRSATWEAMADETGRPTPRLGRPDGFN